MALNNNPTLKEIVDETERLNNLIAGKITPNVGEYNAGHYMTNQISVGDYSGTGGACTYFAIPNKNYIKDVHWIMSSTPDLQSQNIVAGKNILGVVGSYSGKKWASGTIATNSRNDFTKHYYGQYNQSSIKITGLDFIPTYGYAYGDGGMVSFTRKGHSFGNVAHIGQDLWSWYSGNDFFEIPVTSSKPYYWIVFEE